MLKLYPVKILVLFLILAVGFFGSFQTLARSQCAAAYRNDSPLHQRTVHLDLDSEAARKQLALYRMLEPAMAMDMIAENLTKRGVHIKVTSHEVPALLFFKKTVKTIEFLPVKDGPFLNFLAFKMKENFGTRFFYEAKFDSPQSASFDTNANNIYVSGMTALTGFVDALLLHEIRHAAMGAKEISDKENYGRGVMTKKAQTRFPWQTTRMHGYERGMTFQELDTYFQGRTYDMNTYFKALKTDEAAEAITNHDRYGSHQMVFKELNSALKYVLKNIDNQDIVSRSHNLYAEQITLRIREELFDLQMTVPTSFIRAHFPTYKTRQILLEEETLPIAKKYVEHYIQRTDEAMQREQKYMGLKLLLSSAFHRSGAFDLKTQQIVKESRNIHELLASVETLFENAVHSQMNLETQLQNLVQDGKVRYQKILSHPELKKQLAAQFLSPANQLWKVSYTLEGKEELLYLRGKSVAKALDYAISRNAKVDIEVYSFSQSEEASTIIRLFEELTYSLDSQRFAM